jgi:hypothetical protein
MRQKRLWKLAESWQNRRFGGSMALRAGRDEYLHINDVFTAEMRMRVHFSQKACR